MKYLILATLLIAGEGCSSTCKGVYTERVDGVLKKFYSHKVSGISGCVTDTVELSHFEDTTEIWTNKAIRCVPQTGLTTQTYISANNFYSYRDSRLYLDLDSSSGIFRRLTLAQGKTSGDVFTRLQGCYYVRENQLLLDTRESISDQYLDPAEIFTFTASATSLDLLRYDASADWTAYFCPTLDTPWGTCDFLRNGNVLFQPVLTADQAASLLHDALLIRKQFGYIKASATTFNDLWNNPEQSGRMQAVREDYKYAVQTIVDEPRYTSEAWKEYVRGNRPIMVDTSASDAPLTCWSSSKTVVYNDGTSGKVFGESCLDNGVMTFTGL